MLKCICLMIGLFMVLDLSKSESKFNCAHDVFPANKELYCVYREEEISFWTSYAKLYRYDNDALKCILRKWRKIAPCYELPIMPVYFHSMEECEEECRGIAK